MQPYHLMQGDCLTILRGLPDDSFDAMISDPPYSSGGLLSTQRRVGTAEKYLKSPLAVDFNGDAKDQRSWSSWLFTILCECRRVLKPAAPLCLFSDWRQYPAITDVLQWADFVWRGVVIWNKSNGRPQPGRFRQSAEFIVWGSKGNFPFTRDVGCLKGMIETATVNSNKRIHQTEKPLVLMRELVKICESGGHILDPFAGGGTTIEAALLEGYEATGIEINPYYFEKMQERLRVFESEHSKT